MRVWGRRVRVYVGLFLYMRLCVCMPNECDEFRMFYCSFAVRSFPISLVRFDVFLYDFFFCTHVRLSASPYQIHIYSHLPSVYVCRPFSRYPIPKDTKFQLDVFFMYGHTTLYTTWYKSHWGDIFMSFCTNVCFADPKNQMDVPYSIRVCVWRTRVNEKWCYPTCEYECINCTPTHTIRRLQT